MKHNSIVTWILIGMIALFAFSKEPSVIESLNSEQTNQKAMDTLKKILNHQNTNTPLKY